MDAVIAVLVGGAAIGSTRATLLGGHRTAGPAPGGGFRVHARLPLDAIP